MRLAFSLNKKDNNISQLFLETFPSYLFILEILLNFNTAYYNKGIAY